MGIYAVGYKFGNILNFLVIQPFNMMWQARMFVIHRQSGHQQIFRHIFVLYSLLLIASGLGLALFGPALMPLLVDSRYLGAASIIPVVTLAYVLLGIGYFLQLGMLLASRTVLIGVVSALSAVANLVFNWVLIRSFGMQGAAWATLLGFLVLAVGSYICSDRVFPLALGTRSRRESPAAGDGRVFCCPIRAHIRQVGLIDLEDGGIRCLRPPRLGNRSSVRRRDRDDYIG